MDFSQVDAYGIGGIGVKSHQFLFARRISAAQHVEYASGPVKKARQAVANLRDVVAAVTSGCRGPFGARQNPVHRPQHRPLDQLAVDHHNAGIGLGDGVDDLAGVGDLVGVG